MGTVYYKHRYVAGLTGQLKEQVGNFHKVITSWKNSEFPSSDKTYYYPVECFDATSGCWDQIIELPNGSIRNHSLFSRFLHFHLKWMEKWRHVNVYDGDLVEHTKKFCGDYKKMIFEIREEYELTSDEIIFIFNGLVY